MIVSCSKDLENQSSLFTLLTDVATNNENACKGLSICDLKPIP